MYCKNCGSNIKENAKFCGKCGCKVLSKQTKKKSPAIFVVILIFLIGISLAAVFFLWNNYLENIWIVETESMEMPDNPTETDDYFWDNATVIDVVTVKDSQDVLTESEVSLLLQERGFTNYPITYKYTIDGEYEGETEIQSDSNEKHPMYQTFYMSDNGDIWTIFVVNGSVIANPVSLNSTLDIDVQVLYADSNQLTSYAEEGNKFYITVPFDETIILKEIDTVDATELNKISDEVMMNE